MHLDQTQLVYAFGNPLVDDWNLTHPQPMSLAACTECANRLLCACGGHPVKVTDGELTPQISADLMSGRRHRIPAQGSADRLWLPQWARNPIVIIHEACHALFQQHGDFTEDHGPRFVRLFLELLSRHQGFDLPSLLGSVQAAGISVAPLSAISSFLAGTPYPLSSTLPFGMLET